MQELWNLKAKSKKPNQIVSLLPRKDKKIPQMPPKIAEVYAF
jgi:hypothetical protein